MKLRELNVLHADDDNDDREFFKEALDSMNPPTHHMAVNDGEQLMQYLENEKNELPDILFLDLNMPRKNGFECLKAIKVNERLKKMPIIIFSTAFEQEMVSRLYDDGAQYYIQKPSDFDKLKQVIAQTFTTLLDQGNIMQPSKDHFVLAC